MKYLIMFVFVVIDLVSGIIMALKNKEYDSSKMRDGLFNKCGIMIVVSVASLIDYTQGYLDIGAELPLTNAVLCYTVLMEIASILENVSRICPAIVPSFIKNMLVKVK